MIKVTFEQGAAPGAGELPVRREQEEKTVLSPRNHQGSKTARIADK